MTPEVSLMEWEDAQDVGQINVANPKERQKENEDDQRLFTTRLRTEQRRKLLSHDQQSDIQNSHMQWQPQSEIQILLSFFETSLSFGTKTTRAIVGTKPSDCIKRVITKRKQKLSSVKMNPPKGRRLTNQSSPPGPMHSIELVFLLEENHSTLNL
jgi:hypothetical protein